MDGSVTILDANTGAALAACRPHSKYVVRAAFDPRGGAAIATASFDQSCCLLRLAGSGAAGAEALSLEVVRQVRRRCGPSERRGCSQRSALFSQHHTAQRQRLLPPT